MKEIDLEKLFEIAGDKVLMLEEGLHRFSKLLRKNFELRLAFEDPSLPQEAKKKLFADVFPEAQALLQDLVYLLIDERLTHKILWLSERFTRLVSKKMGINFVEVTTAYSLSPEELWRLENFIGGKVRFRIEVDPSLIGGIKVLTGDGRYFDGSLLGNLERLKENLIHA